MSQLAANPALDLETLFAAIGLGPILAAKPALHRAQWNRAAGLPKEIRRRILRFVASDAFAPANDVPDFDYEAVKGYVSQDGLNEEQSRALMAIGVDPELAQELGLQATRILTWANPLLPRDERPAVVGTRPVEPEPVASADFARVWQVAVDPMHALDELEDGSLTDEQVKALALLYPQVYGEIRQAIQDATAAMEARRKGWEPAPQKAALLAMLRQEEQIDAELAATVQQMYATQPGAAAAPPAARRRARKASGGGDATGEGLTPGSKQAGGA